MGRHRWPFVASLIAVIACSPELSMRERLVQQDLVEDRFDDWVRAMNNRATDSLFAMYHQDSDLRVIWPHGRMTTGWEETRQAWRDFYGAIDYMNFAVQSPAVEVLSATVAVTSFRHSTDIVRGGRRQPVRPGHGTVIWTKDRSNGEWRIRLSQIAYEVPES